MSSERLRRSSRIPKKSQSCWSEATWRQGVFGTAKTVLLSRHGAGIVSEYKLSPEQERDPSFQETNRETEVRVVASSAPVGGSYTYGVAFLDQSIDFWAWSSRRYRKSEKESEPRLAAVRQLQSSRDGQQSDLESDVYMVNEGIVRFCKNCGSSTFWKRADDAAEGEAAPPPIEEEQSPLIHRPTSNHLAPGKQAKYLRTKVSFKACIRTFAFGDDIVTCEDISRAAFGSSPASITP